MKPLRAVRLSFCRLSAAALAAVAGPAYSDVVPIPAGPNATAVIQANGPLTTVNLTAPSRIEWQDFTLAAGRELRYLSPAGASFPSLNIVRSPVPAVIDGRITADGPFYLISPGGVQVGTTGSITAPRVLLSTMNPADESRTLADGGGLFIPNDLGGAIGVDGTLETSAGSLVILSGTVSTGNRAHLRSAGGDLRIAAVDSSPVSLSPNGILTAPSARGSGLMNSTGWLDARRVEIVSDGFLINGGRISALGQGNQVRLAAPDIVHESRPDNSSAIITSSLSVEGRFSQVGAIINPNDGANPAVAAGLRQTPRLSTAGFIATVDPGQTQLSHSPLQTPQTTASAVPPPFKRSTNNASTSLAVRRRGATGTSSSSKGFVKKASFFGQKIKH